MKFISRNTDYAIRSLVFMAALLEKRDKRVVSVDEIVKKLHLPKKFTRRILQRLAKKKLLISYKGKEGGFLFYIKPGRITLPDIIEVFQGKIDLTNCLLRGRVCPNVKKCTVRRKLKELGYLLNKELSKMTIKSLVTEE